ncbi:MAG: hypothetical protein C4292_05455 [Nitrososphaera sp.]
MHLDAAVPYPVPEAPDGAAHLQRACALRVFEFTACIKASMLSRNAAIPLFYTTIAAGRRRSPFKRGQATLYIYIQDNILCPGAI